MVAIALRRAKQEDSEFLYSWANDPVTIRGSFVRNQIVERATHEKWFSEKLNDSSVTLYIVENSEAEPVGQIRFDLSPDAPSEVWISLGIAPPFRSKGYATSAIKAASQKLFEESEITLIKAGIKRENIASDRAFEKAGFLYCGIILYQEIPAIYRVFRKESA